MRNRRGPLRSRRTFPPQEDKLLLQLWEDHLTVSEVAEEAGKSFPPARSWTVVQARLSVITKGKSRSSAGPASASASARPIAVIRRDLAQQLTEIVRKFERQLAGDVATDPVQIERPIDLTAARSVVAKINKQHHDSAAQQAFRARRGSITVEMRRRLLAQASAVSRKGNRREECHSQTA